MNIFDIKDFQDFIDKYDKKSYTLWDNSKDKNVKKFRKMVRYFYLNEQKKTCFYCKQYIFSKNGLHWQVEHILPKSIFPQFLFEPRNLIVICPDCNREKSNKNPHIEGIKACKQLSYPNASGRYTIVHPFFDTYEHHIEVVPAHHCDYPHHYFLRALTQKGKETVKMCDLNRFYQEFAGYKDMKGKQLESIDKFIEETGIGQLSRAEKVALIQKLSAELI